MYLFDIGLRIGLMIAGQFDGSCFDELKKCVIRVCPLHMMKYFNKYTRVYNESKEYLRDHDIYVIPDENDDDDEIDQEEVDYQEEFYAVN